MKNNQFKRVWKKTRMSNSLNHTYLIFRNYPCLVHIIVNIKVVCSSHNKPLTHESKGKKIMTPPLRPEEIDTTDLGASSLRPMYFGLDASKILKFSAFPCRKCMKWSREQAAGLVEYINRASSKYITKVVGKSLFPKANLAMDCKILKSRQHSAFKKIWENLELTMSILMTGIKSLQFFPRRNELLFPGLSRSGVPSSERLSSSFSSSGSKWKH